MAAGKVEKPCSRACSRFCTPDRQLSPFFAATNDYTLAYYVNDACLVLTCLVVLKLHVQKHPSVEKTSAAIKKIFSIPALVLFAILGMFGFMFGARDSLYSIYLQDELGADTKLISQDEQVLPQK